MLPNNFDNIIKVKIAAGVKLPLFAKTNDAGADLFALKDIKLIAGQQQLIDTGVQIEFPPAPDGWKWAAYVCPRSGMALKHRLSITNAPGIIDENYRGNIGVILSNEGYSDYEIHREDKIAQLVAVLLPDVKYEWVSELSETDRGEGGFGHTGK